MLQKLNTHKTPNIPHLTPIRTDCTYKLGAHLLTYIKNNISLSQLNTSNTFPIKLQNHQISPFYITAITYRKHSTQLSKTEDDSIIISTYALYSHNKTSKHNHHGRCQCSLINIVLATEDQRRELIEDILINSNHITLNTSTPTPLPLNQTQQSISPRITTASADLCYSISWQTIHFLTSNHLPLLTTLSTVSPRQNKCLTISKHSLLQIQ